MGKCKTGLISVIIPVYNELRYLEACVNSVLSQSYNEYELLLVDDGSNNGAENDCERLSSRDDRIKVIHKENEGLSAARITGLSQAKGEWILFIDDDDVVSPYIIQTLLEFVNDEVDIVAGGRYDTEAPEAYHWKYDPNPQFLKERGKAVVELIPSDKYQNYITIPLWGKLYRKSFLNSLNLEEYKTLCPTIFFEDVLMTPIIYSKAREICIVKSVMYLHREVSTSISRSGLLTSFYTEQVDSGDILLDYVKRNNLKKYYNYRIGIYLVSIIRLFCLIDQYNEYNVDSVREAIKKKERKYRLDFYIGGDKTIKSFCICLLFDISPLLLKVLSLRYFKRL